MSIWLLKMICTAIGDLISRFSSPRFCNNQPWSPYSTLHRRLELRQGIEVPYSI